MRVALPIQIPRQGRRRHRRHRRARPVEYERLIFPRANGEDHVAMRPASGGGPWVWLQVRSIYGESMQNAELLLHRRQLRSVVRLLVRAARQLDALPSWNDDSVGEAYRDEVSCRAAVDRYEAERGGIELPEDF